MDGFRKKKPAPVPKSALPAQDIAPLDAAPQDTPAVLQDINLDEPVHLTTKPRRKLALIITLSVVGALAVLFAAAAIWPRSE